MSPALRREGEQANIIALVMLVISSGMIVHTLGKMFGDVPGIGAIWYVPSAIAIWLLSSRLGDIIGVLARVGIVLALPLLCLVSTLWSREPIDTFISSLKVLAMVVVSAYLAARLSWADLVRAIFLMLLAAIALSTVLAVALPAVGRMTGGDYAGAWSGVFAEKQFLGISSAYAIIIAGTMSLIDKRWWPVAAGLVLISLLCLVMARSVTALFLFSVGLSAFVFVALLRSGSRAAVWAIIALLATLALTYTAISMAQGDLLRVVGRDPTFTSRTIVWEGANELIKMRPILGWGYDAVWTHNREDSAVSAVIERMGWLPFHAHSTWLDARLQLGWAGLGLTIAIVAATFFRAVAAAPRTRAAYWCVPFVAMIFSMSFSETIVFYPNDFVSFLMLLTLCKLTLDRGRGPYRTSASSTGEIHASRF